MSKLLKPGGRGRTFFRRPLFFVAAVALLLAVATFTAVVLLRPDPLPDHITKQLSFSILYPDKKSGYNVAPETVSYIAKDKVLLFHVKKGDSDITLTQQATPDPFNDIPDYFTKVAEKLHGYTTFDTIHGKVSLTRPEELKGGQSAMFNGKGTLLFAHPSGDLSNDEWRSFFKDLTIIK